MTTRFNEERLKAPTATAARRVVNLLHFPYQPITAESFTDSDVVPTGPPPQIGPLKLHPETKPKDQR